MSIKMHVPQNTGEIREKMLLLWKLVDEKKISAAEVRVHISIARVVLETMKVEIAVAHLARANIPPVPLRGKNVMLENRKQ